MRRLTLATTAVACLLAAAPVVTALPASAATPPASGGDATADLVTVNGTLGGVQLADAVLAPAASTVDSSQPKTSTAAATNASLSLLNQSGDLLVEAEQTAPPTAPEGVRDELLSVAVPPLLTTSVATAEARAVGFAEAACDVVADGTVVAASSSRVADAVVLPGAVGGPSGGAVTLANDADPRGAVVSTTEVALVPQAGAGAAVRSTATTQITSLSLLGGAVVADVLTAPRAVVTAGGSAGSAKADLTQPVLRINGQTLLAGQTLRPVGIPGAPVLELTVGTLRSELAADGTRATAQGNLLTLKVLAAAGAVPLATVTVGDVAASAAAPAGGVRCAAAGAGADGSDAVPATPGSGGTGTGADCAPLRLSRIDASASGVNPGSRFTYTINVANPCDEPLADVEVVATVSASDGPLPTLVSASPEPSSTNGGQVSFTLGTIPAGGSKTITLLYEVPASASVGTTYGDSAQVEATYRGEPVQRTLTIDLPRVDAAGSGGCAIDRSQTSTSHSTVAVGDRYTQFVSVYNTGGEPCTGVTVSTELPAGTEFDSCTDDCTREGRRVVWQLPAIPAGGSRTVAVTALVPSGSGAPAAGTELEATATVDADDVAAVELGPVGPTVAESSTPAGRVTPTRGAAGSSDEAASGPGSGSGEPGSTFGSGEAMLPNTGATPVLGLLGLLLVATAVGLRRRMSAPAAV